MVTYRRPARHHRARGARLASVGRRRRPSRSASRGEPCSSSSTAFDLVAVLTRNDRPPTSSTTSGRTQNRRGHPERAAEFRNGGRRRRRYGGSGSPSDPHDPDRGVDARHADAAQAGVARDRCGAAGAQRRRIRCLRRGASARRLRRRREPRGARTSRRARSGGALARVRPDARRELATASFLLLTSRSEGSPLVLVEAMAAGCLPIAYDVRYGPSDLIRNGRNGFLVRARRRRRPRRGDRASASTAAAPGRGDASCRDEVGEPLRRGARHAALGSRTPSCGGAPAAATIAEVAPDSRAGGTRAARRVGSCPCGESRGVVRLGSSL